MEWLLNLLIIPALQAGMFLYHTLVLLLRGSSELVKMIDPDGLPEVLCLDEESKNCNEPVCIDIVDEN